MGHYQVLTIHVTGVFEGEESIESTKKNLEKEFFKFMKSAKLQIQEALQISHTTNTGKSTPNHFIIK